MHIERIRFDEVFDVEALRGDFSFRSHGRPRYGVNLQNRVIPTAGSTFAVAFEKPGDWDTVLGCRDLAGRQVMLREPSWAALMLQGGDLLLSGSLLIGAGLAMAASWPGLVAAALFTLAIVYAIVHVVRLNRAVTRALLAVGERDDSHDNISAARPSTVQ